MVDDLTVTCRCRGPSDEPREVEDLNSDLYLPSVIWDQDHKPEVKGDGEREAAVGNHVVPAACQAGGQVAHDVPAGGGGGEHLLLPPAAPAQQPLTALTHPPTLTTSQPKRVLTAG